MEKSKKFLRAAGVLMGATMLTTCVLGGTLAQYVTNGKGTADATVAKWDIKLNDSKLTDTVTCDLFKGTIGDLDKKTIADDTNPDLSAETLEQDDSVATGKIAPGTWGKEVFKVTCDIETDASVLMSINKNASVTPDSDGEKILKQLKFSTTGKPDSWKSYDQLEELTGVTTTVKHDDLNKDVELDLYWMWTFDQVDTLPDDSANVDNELSGLTGNLIDVEIGVDQAPDRTE